MDGLECLKDDGTDDSAKDLLIIVVTTGRRMSMTNLRTLAGMGSNSHDLEAELMISLRTSVSVVDEKQSKGDPQSSMSVFKASIPKSFFEIASWSQKVDIFPVRNLPMMFASSPLFS